MRDWPHSPAHWLAEAGAYMVTAGTYLKKPLFSTRERLTLLCDTLLQLAEEHDWKLQAWAVFPNHYHFVGDCPQPENLRVLMRKLHSITAHRVNQLDGETGRRVWFQYWDTRLTIQTSYVARLNYVHQNAVRHGVVRLAVDYPWCSAGWFERKAERAFYQNVINHPSSKIDVRDDYKVSLAKEVLG